MTIGELLKQYRIEQGKKQKEFIAGVVSPSYYSKIEKDTHRITAEDLLAILNKNKIAPADFFKKMNKVNRDRDTQTDYFSTEIDTAYYANDRERIQNLLKEIENSKLDKDTKATILLVTKGTLESIKKPDKEPDNELRQELKDKIFSIPNFNRFKFELYTNFMPFYDLDSNVVITKNIIKQFKNGDDKKTKMELPGLIFNIVSQAIENNRYDVAKYFIEEEKSMQTGYQNFLFKDAIDVMENLVAYHDDHDSKHIDTCMLVYENMKLAGMPAFAEQAKEFVEQYKDQ